MRVHTYAAILDGDTSSINASQRTSTLTVRTTLLSNMPLLELGPELTLSVAAFVN
jgi:hypothetical protein